ncbi:MAG: HTH domain-containing protein [Candidatus Bathyarchaeota archaeon]|nr:HTH domain-containing protein [Candidatus Bathyarchaeota archaeon]MDH5745432.1 HTH domain-containing protein [Candidatus Bathyarchaeota archaeon]
MKNDITDTKTSIGSTSEKCPKMSHLMLDEGGRDEIQRLEKLLFPERSDFSGFHGQENESFSAENYTKNRCQTKRKPEYRKINKYFKNTEQYWKERNRRKKAWELSGQGFTYKEIAEKLGVSDKTVQRDIKKIRPYYCRLSRKYFRELEQQKIMKLNAELAGKNISQQYRILSKKMDTYMKLMKIREYRRHVMNVTFDFDALVAGGRPLVISPSVCSPIAKPFHIRFWMKSANNKRMIGSLQLSDVR